MEPFSEKDPQTYQKSIRNPLKRAYVVAKSKTLITPTENDYFMVPFFRLGASTTLKMDSGPVAPKRPSRTALSPASETAFTFFWSVDLFLVRLIFFWSGPKKGDSYDGYKKGNIGLLKVHHGSAASLNRIPPNI